MLGLLRSDEKHRSQGATSASRSPLVVRGTTPEEVEWFDSLLAEHPYLGAGGPVGDYLRQVVAQDGRPVALLVWGPACYALQDRDRWIAGSASPRTERLKQERPHSHPGRCLALLARA